MSNKNSRSMKTFYTVWFGQLISTLGSGLTGFALGVWLYERTGSVTLFALNILAFSLPSVLMAPFVGVMTDRYDRRKIMLIGDIGAGVSTFILFLLLSSDALQTWHIYLATAVGSIFNSFQWPAYMAATTMMVPKEQLGRASGLSQIGQALSQLLSPALAGVLYLSIGLQGVMGIDFVTFLFAVLTLLIVRIPQPVKSQKGEESKGSVWTEAKYGWHYIRQRPGLLGLLLWAAVVNFALAFFGPVFLPMLLNMTTVAVVGFASSVIGVAMLIGTLAMSVWGGPKRRVLGIFVCGSWLGVCVMLVGLRPYLPMIIGGAFLGTLVVPIANGASQVLWQTKVEPDIQGRVFAMRRMIAQSIAPVATLMAGPLIDQILEPAMVEGGALANSVGRVVGVGAGRGGAVIFIVMGLLVVFASFLAYLHPRVRNIETEIPDVVVEPSTETAVPEPAPSAT